ncbi:MAG: glycine cleavage system aminomethyltransferase GcvT, partial [Bacteroidales bacterium]|nr:glycine cleavage system aminomethyltransferase GcvT [Bacteroidales bacterium]
MKTTQFNKKHKEFGAKMVEFVGFEMPVEYSGINDEHINVRKNVGVFDVSHMGEVWVKGPKAFEFVQKVTSNDVSKISLGEAQYSCFPNDKGGIVDDLIVYYYEPEKYLLVINASNIEKDWNWLVKQNTEGAELENASDAISQLAIQGPNATKVLQKLTD